MPQLTTCFPPSRSLLAAPPTCLQASAHQKNILCQLVIVLFKICQTLSWGENITTEDDKMKHKSEYGTQGGILGLGWRTVQWLVLTDRFGDHTLQMVLCVFGWVAWGCIFCAWFLSADFNHPAKDLPISEESIRKHYFRSDSWRKCF